MSDSGVALIEFKPMHKNSLRGFATVRLRSGLTIHDVTVCASSGKAWASLPSKPMIDRDGQVLRDRETGKVRYAPILEWADRQTADRFSGAVVEAVEARHPGAVLR
jgi:hypothetical protein